MKNSRGVVWLLVRDGRRDISHAYHTNRDGDARGTLCGAIGDVIGPGSRRIGIVCGRCKSIVPKQPKRIGTPCDTPLPSSKGSPCRVCGFAIQATFPGWKHVVWEPAEALPA